MRQTELKDLIESAYESTEISIKILSGNDNPQMVEIKNEYVGQAKAFSAILDAMNNNRVALKILNMHKKAPEKFIGKMELVETGKPVNVYADKNGLLVI